MYSIIQQNGFSLISRWASAMEAHCVCALPRTARRESSSPVPIESEFFNGFNPKIFCNSDFLRGKGVVSVSSFSVCASKNITYPTRPTCAL